MAKPYQTAHPERWETGRVKWFNLQRGYGFVTKDDGTDILVHARVCHSAGVVQMRPGTFARVRVETTGGLDRAADIEILKP